MIWLGMVKVKESLLLEMGGKGVSSFNHILCGRDAARTRFGHAFLMDSGSSAGEISGHSKVWIIAIFIY